MTKKYTFNPCWELVFGHETRRYKKIDTYWELTFGLNKLKKIKLKDENTTIDAPEGSKNAWSVTGAYYFGQVLNKGKRLTFPLYMGFGTGYYKGGDIHHMVFFIGWKLRTQYYLTNTMGIWAGGSYNLGVPISKGYLEAGITYQL